jgi:hypothetical protein
MGNGFEPDQFRHKLVRYIYDGCLSRLDTLLSIISKSIPFKKNSSEILKQFQKFNAILSNRIDISSSVAVDIYEGKNCHVLKMKSYLEQNLKNDLMGAYIHGSLGTYEEIPYSDFDGLVIIKDEVFESPRRLVKVTKKLSDARSIMFDFDPLQHHGWFVLTEADLKYYPEYYFPLELFVHAKSLFHDKGLKLAVRTQNSSERNRQVFDDLSNSIIKRITGKKYPKNMYQLKGLLSEFMLLPACYVQVRDGKGIYKKFSFDAARIDFHEEDWSIMDEVATLRKNWLSKMSPLRKWMMTRPETIFRLLTKKYAPKIPDTLGNLLTDNFYVRIQHFVKIMQRKLD